jgi:uncharacterized alkaline shock family protein YloU
MQGHASISSDVVARYAADAMREVDGVHSLPRRAVRIDGDGDARRLELHVAVDWGASIPSVGREVQERVR